jgi:DNA modification methylase
MPPANELLIEYLNVCELRPQPRNARTHSKKQIRQIADSIRSFGFTNPILIDDGKAILAGHGRIEAAKSLGMARIPCVRLSDMTAVQKRAYALADNKLALNAGWDEELLTIELQELSACELDFDIEITGFSTAEIDGLVESLKPEEQGDPADEELPALGEGPPVSRPGDLWILENHSLYCGDSRDPKSFEARLGSEKAQMVFTDPPYNVPIEGNVSGLGKVKHREFAMASGEMSSAEFTCFLEAILANLAAFSVDGSIHFVCMHWRHAPEILQAGSEAYSELKNLCVWVKDNGGMGTFYRSRHELIFAFKSGDAPHINSFELGQHGRYRTNVWQYRGMNSLSANRQQELGLHPTVKPVAMVADAIKDVSSWSGIVLDCFGGSGSTLIAAHKTGRRARLIEIDPIYVDRIIRRWQLYAKDDAILATTEQDGGSEHTVEAVAEERGLRSVPPAVKEDVP